MKLNRRTFLRASSAVLVAGAVPNVRGAESSPDAKEVRALADKALAFLKTRQTPEGAFAPRLGGPGISALVAVGLIRHGYGEDPAVRKTLAYLEKTVKPDGGIYDSRLANYTTCVALVAFKEANTKGQYDAVIANASKFLKSLQSGDGTATTKDAGYGGVGYDGKGRPDLSNTQYFLDALQAAGVPGTDPAVQKAMAFINRCQNLPGETNDQPFAQKATTDDKGGFTYVPSLGDEGNPRRTPEGGLRSEGAMTYAGLKSFLYAGVSKDDQRVKAAVDWIRRHYTLDANPGQGTAGLYYYFHTFAKAMDALGEDPFVDAAGKPHHWRAELFAALMSRQKADGSWANDNRALMETTPELATAYAVLALSYCQPRK